jgi:hypothetical protein
LEVAETDRLLVELVESEGLEPVCRLGVLEPLFGGVVTTRTTAAATTRIAVTEIAAALLIVLRNRGGALPIEPDRTTRS